jgi:hypothetical protein
MGSAMPDDLLWRINSEVADAVGWDDRKELARMWQENGGTVPGGLQAIYPALIAVAQYGAERAAGNLIAEVGDMREELDRLRLQRG